MLLLILMAVHQAQAATITNRKLSPEMQHDLGNVYDDPNYQISPDGQFVVFIADPITQNYPYLYSAPIDGNAPPIQLGVEHAYVDDFAISPDSNWVVYSAPNAADSGRELFRVPIGGGTAVSLSESLPTGSSIGHFTISPEGTQVAFEANPPISDATELFIVPITGGTATKLYGNPDSNVRSIWLYSANGRFIVFVARNNFDDQIRLFSVDVVSGNVEQLSAPSAPGENIGYFQISMDSNYVVYTADHEVIDQDELYSVPIIGGTIIKLNSELVSSSVWGNFEIAPNSQYVVYHADQDIAQHSAELWSVPIGGGPTVQINKPFDINQYPGVFKISPDSTTVVYHAPNLGNWRDDLYSAPIVGGTATKLNEFANALRIRHFDISSDNARVVYSSDVLVTIDQEEYLDNHIFSIPLGGGEIIQLTEEREWQYQYSFTLGHTGDLVFFRSHNELFCTGITGGPITDFEIEMVAGGRILGSFQIDPTDTYVVYRADQDTLEMEELYVAFGKEITAVTLKKVSAATQAVWGITAVVFILLTTLSFTVIRCAQKS